MWERRFFERSELFAPVASAAERLTSFVEFPTPEQIDAVLGELAGVRFVRQPPKPRRARRTPVELESMYDARVVRGEVPTRPGSWHDLMNALVWASFPIAKRTLHGKQHRLVVDNGVGAPCRSPEMDALAMVDEGGIIVANGVSKIFGHAIYEGLVRGWQSPVGKAIVVDEADADAGLARILRIGRYMTHVRMALPSLS